MNHEQLLEKWFKGDANAIALAAQLGFISQIWDDLIDGDKTVKAEDINDMMFHAIVSMHKNPFYRANESVLGPLFEQAIDTWHEANDLELRGELLLVAYTIRSVITPVIIRIAYLIGGREWGRAAALEIRRAVYDESFESYVNEVTNGLS